MESKALSGSQSRLENLCKVHRRSPSALLNLFAATETVGNDQCFRRGTSNRGEQDALAHCLRDIELFLFKSEGTGHPATTCIRTLQNRARAP